MSPTLKLKGRSKAKPMKDEVSDLVKLVIAYTKQETLEPIKKSVKSLGWGLIGAVLTAVSVVLLAIGFLRALQAEFGSVGARQTVRGTAHLSGSLSWVPYAGAAVFCLAVMLWAVLRIGKGKK